MKIPKEYKWVHVHRSCGNPGLLSNRELKEGDEVLAEYFILPNGEKPEDGDSIVCGNCGEQITDPGLTRELIQVLLK